MSEREYWWVPKTLMLALYCELYKGKKAVADVRTSNLKLQGPVGLQGVNKW